jgi:uncharacterized protein
MAMISVKEYFAALKQNKLLGVKCKNCGFVTAPPRLSCRRCGGQDTDILELSGRGKITTFTSVCIPPENRRGKAPYLVVMVELEEGSWIMGDLIGPDPSTATIDLIGRQVRMDNSSLDVSDPKSDAAPQFILQ